MQQGATRTTSAGKLSACISMQHVTLARWHQQQNTTYSGIHMRLNASGTDTSCGTVVSKLVLVELELECELATLPALGTSTATQATSKLDRQVR